MGRGRPIGSMIRQNIVEILYYLGEGYAYDIYKVYSEVFPKVSMRSVYYHLRKGSDIGEFLVKDVKIEDGDYSWGNKAEKVYYSLGPKAIAKGNQLVEDVIKRKNAEKA